ncbi:50S ribosomal protein L6 [Patescibacteria group bacterium]|nr:50S ribosomal protein L6 [Patescibacteria group bacterium]MBU4512660.1 50S ribosomal protein L6 [Patescibacteria group bacterium]
MSRVGKMPIEIPDGVSIDIKDNLIKVKGPKGELEQKIVRGVSIVLEDKVIKVRVEKPTDKKQRSLWGLYRSLIANMVEGLARGFEKKLEISGVGFKAEVSGDKLVLNVGFSHLVEFDIPQGIEIKTEKNIIAVSGVDKQLVGETAAQIRAFKKVEPYKLKGIKYAGEQVRKKAGKVVKAAEG